MSVVNLLASRLGRNDEEPNIALAQRLASEVTVRWSSSSEIKLHG